MHRFLMTAAAAAVFATSAFAENAKPAPPSGNVKTVSVPQDAVLSYNLIDQKIVDGSNNNVGEIKDLVIEKGKLVSYILSVGGFLGMGEHYVAVDPSSVSLTYDDNAKKWKASINATKDQLKEAPEFKYEGKFKR